MKDNNLKIEWATEVKSDVSQGVIFMVFLGVCSLCGSPLTKSRNLWPVASASEITSCDVANLI